MIIYSLTCGSRIGRWGQVDLRSQLKTKRTSHFLLWRGARGTTNEIYFCSSSFLIAHHQQESGSHAVVISTITGFGGRADSGLVSALPHRLVFHRPKSIIMSLTSRTEIRGVARLKSAILPSASIPFFFLNVHL
jgi:hypothetical protein